MEELHPNEEFFLKQPFEMVYGRRVRFRYKVTNAWWKGAVICVGLSPGEPAHSVHEWKVEEKKPFLGVHVRSVRHPKVTQWMRFDEIEIL